MTGMGRDGVAGCTAILAAGGFTIGQDETSSVVYGMNKAAFIEGAIKAQFALDELPAILQDIAGFRAGVESTEPADRGRRSFMGGTRVAAAPKASNDRIAVSSMAKQRKRHRLPR